MTEEEKKLPPKELEALYKRKFGCIDCGADEQYMLVTGVWLEAFPDYKTVFVERRKAGLHTCLCMECVESRLGRKLVIEDFVDAPINRKIFFGFRLGLKRNSIGK